MVTKVVDVKKSPRGPEFKTDGKGKQYVEYVGIDGLKFRLRPGQPLPQIKDGDSLKPQKCFDAYARVFDMGNPDDVKAYGQVWDAIGRGEMIMSHEQVQWAEMSQNFKVFLRWGEVYLTMSTERQADNGKQQNFN